MSSFERNERLDNVNASRDNTSFDYARNSAGRSRGGTLPTEKTTGMSDDGAGPSDFTQQDLSRAFNHVQEIHGGEAHVPRKIKIDIGNLINQFAEGKQAEVIKTLKKWQNSEIFDRKVFADKVLE